MVPCPDAPLLSTGSLGSVPPLPRYFESTPTPHDPSRFASLPSLGGTAVVSLRSLPQVVGPLTPAGLDLSWPVALPASLPRRPWGLPGSWVNRARLPSL